MPDVKMCVTQQVPVRRVSWGVNCVKVPSNFKVELFQGPEMGRG